MNAQKRRMRTLEHKRLAEEAVAKRRAMLEAERQRELEDMQETQRREELRRQIIEQERRRMLREHAPQLINYLPKARLLRSLFCLCVCRPNVLCFCVCRVRSLRKRISTCCRRKCARRWRSDSAACGPSTSDTERGDAVCAVCLLFVCLQCGLGRDSRCIVGDSVASAGVVV